MGSSFTPSAYPYQPPHFHYRKTRNTTRGNRASTALRPPSMTTAAAHRRLRQTHLPRPQLTFRHGRRARRGILPKEHFSAVHRDLQKRQRSEKVNRWIGPDSVLTKKCQGRMIQLRLSRLAQQPLHREAPHGLDNPDEKQ